MRREYVVVAISVVHSLEHLDLVVDRFEETGLQRLAAMGHDDGEVVLQPLDKPHESRDVACSEPRLDETVWAA